MDPLTVTLGILAITVNWAIVLAGMPHQIYKLYKSKKAEGFSITTFSLYLIAFLFGSFYGVQIKNWALVVGNIPLVFFSSIILGQIIYYNYKNN